MAVDTDVDLVALADRQTPQKMFSEKRVQSVGRLFGGRRISRYGDSLWGRNVEKGCELERVRVREYYGIYPYWQPKRSQSVGVLHSQCWRFACIVYLFSYKKQHKHFAF